MPTLVPAPPTAVPAPGLGWVAWNHALAATRRHEAVFFPLIRLRMWLPRALDYPLVGPGTDLVVEGYWRSGNSFAAAALAAANPGARMAHHTHAAATVKRAVRLGRPTVVLARRPLDAVTGRVLLGHGTSARQALGEYVQFHRDIAPLAGGYVRVTFDELTTDLGRTVRRVNARFGTAFRPPSAAAVRITPRHETADLPWLAGFSREQVRAYRDRLRDELRADPLLAVAEALYDAFAGVPAADTVSESGRLAAA